MVTRPISLITLWISFHERLATKARLHKIGLIDNLKCYFCNDTETQQHMFFKCRDLKAIWEKMLKWIQVHHNSVVGAMSLV